MKGLFVFRQDLRCHDHPLLLRAVNECEQLDLFLLVPKDLERWAQARRVFWDQSVQDLQQQISDKGSSLSIVTSLPNTRIYDVCYASTIFSYNEDKEIPKDGTWITEVVDQLFHDYQIKPMTQQFTSFRKQVEEGLYSRASIPESSIESLPPRVTQNPPVAFSMKSKECDSILFKGGERAARAHLKQYFWERRLASTYKETRNEMLGANFSTKFSPYLALGCLSPLAIERELKLYEKEVEKNESTYWIFFELLWREFFRVMYQKYGIAFFRKRGLKEAPPIFVNDGELFEKWCTGQTGVDIVDACMKELLATGYMSNRGRQIVASYLINEYNLDWTLGASFFEKHLIDYDVYSNWGNWMYLAGVGFDPRPRRWFDPEKQAKIYDPRGEFRELWLSSYREKD